MCPICSKNCDYCSRNRNAVCNNGKINIDTKEKGEDTEKLESSSKDVQTSQADLSQGLNLLNEVLTVFQTKKLDIPKEPSITNCRTKICKDAGVETEFPVKTFYKTKLSMSKVFKYSINEEKVNEHPKFMIVNSSQPEMMKSQYSINLNRYKSSSIPQMKLEELKHSLKEKTKSKDAIEEVNRMFATVGKYNNESLDDSNRPVVRTGPRVLPVVKTKNFENPAKKDSLCQLGCARKISCKCCQTSNYYLSCGDSHESCNNGNPERKDSGLNKGDKCVYMLSCPHDRPKSPSVCNCCKRRTKDVSHEDVAECCHF
ncbi:uncharacterized protein LOC126378278 [Pectinophora gossypiella]|uniref:uncharacterized protein LOC126378278 n=1 Tax=Pectinophora gossypiella TaxID=13191 RepID=UPI00214E8551|nr:uncharacterized protein LOC126378278 [Pectinophora gossypiella]